jgi:hypothetical protein
MSENVENTTCQQLTLFVEDSPVRMSALPENGWDLRGNEQRSGQSLLDSFASLSQDGSWLKTCRGYYQATLDDFLVVSSEIWPNSGMMQSGKAYELPTLELPTVGGESSFLPTPQASDGFRAQFSQQAILNDLARGHQMHLIYLLKLVEYDGLGFSESYEMAMGFPEDWTKIESRHSETP